MVAAEGLLVDGCIWSFLLIEFVSSVFGAFISTCVCVPVVQKKVNCQYSRKRDLCSGLYHQAGVQISLHFAKWRKGYHFGDRG